MPIMTVRALPCLIAVSILASALVAAPAQAAPFTPVAKTAKKQKSGSGRVIKNPNHETTSERERRLQRECKGLPNAGACLGYAS
jgi:hypothetical protein